MTQEAGEKRSRTKLGFLSIQAVYLLALALIFISRGVFPSPNLILVILLSLLLWRADDRKLLGQLLPFLVMLLSYQALRNIADDLAHSAVNVENLIQWEQRLFRGAIPTSVLQAHLLDRSFTPALDIVSNAFYMSHFVTPVVFGLALLYLRPRSYWPFVLGLMLLSYSAFVTFILFPAVPPWWATEYGYLTNGPVTLTHFMFPSLALVASPNPMENS